MAVHLRQKGANFYAEFYDPTRCPKRKWVALRTRRADVARQKLVRLERDEALGVFDPWANAAPEEGVTVREAARRFLRSRAGKRPKTQEAYRGVLDRFCRSLPPDLVVAGVEPRHVQAFVGRSRLSDASKASYFRHLRVFFRWAVGAGLIRQSPADRVEVERPGRKEAAFLRPSEVERLVETIHADAAEKGGLVLPGQNVWMAEVIRFAIGTGLRVGELVNVRWRDVDLEHALVVIRNREDFRTKSGAERAVPLVADALAVVRRLAGTRGAAGDEDRVFVSPGGGPLDPAYVSRRFRHFRRLAGLPEGVHLHSLRHTTASWLVMRGVPLPAVQAILGHGDIAVTMRYAHLSPAAVRNEMERAFAEIGQGGRVEEPARFYTASTNPSQVAQNLAVLRRAA